VNDICEALAKSTTLEDEAISTQVVLNKLEDTEKEVREIGKSVVAASIDAEGLYPNLDIKITAR
jgi:hypothetical protein